MMWKESVFTKIMKTKLCNVLIALALTAVVHRASAQPASGVVPAGMALIPAGTFTMGDTVDHEARTIPVSVNVSAFYMDVNLVCYSQWQAVYNWATNHGYGFVNAGLGKTAKDPVCRINWFDAVKWCNARSQQAGLVPVYYTDAGLTKVYTNGEVRKPFVKWEANGYRLPTEAEWEKSARGGLVGKRFPWGDKISRKQANYVSDPSGFSNYDVGPGGLDPKYTKGPQSNFNPHTSPVGSFAPNGYGLYDMAGNVTEWCWDWLTPPPYGKGSPYLGGTDPHGALNPQFGRVRRGGGWGNNADAARCAARTCAGPEGECGWFGFRCAKGL